ncbi:MAG TPA: hypothetical protein DCX27_22220 [Balneola sp.]|nr:hypothetical protein [Balneola sp.]
MPIWLRRFTHKQIYEARSAEAERVKNASPEAANALENEAANIIEEAETEYKRNYVLIENELVYLKQDLDYAKQYPEIRTIHKMLIDAKNEILKFAVANKLMSEAQLEEFTGIVLTEKTLETRSDIFEGLIDVFIPFYRTGKTVEQANQKGLEARSKYFKIRGSFQPVADVFDNMDRFILSTATRGMINNVALKKIKYAKRYLSGDIRKVNSSENLTAMDLSVVEVSEIDKKTGEQKNVLYEFSDPFLAAAISGIESISLPGLNFAASTSNLFRSNIILYPTFGLSQLSQDALSTFTSAGLWVPVVIPLRVVKNFVATMLGINKTHDLLSKRAVVGKWGAYTQAVDDIENNPDWSSSYNTFRRGLEIIPGLTRGNPISIPITNKSPLELSLSGFLHRIAMASDNSIRESVYEQKMLETRIQNYLKNKFSGKPTAWKDTKGDAREAIHKGLEIINFKRAGSAPTVNATRRTVAFSGAMLQASYVQYRVFSLEGVSPSSKLENAGKLLAGLSQLSMLTLIYYSMISDEDEYKNLSDMQKANFYYIPGTNSTIRTRIRPDMTGLLGKVFPEAYLDLQNNRTDVRAFMKRMRDNADKIMAANFIPTLIRPLIEGSVNRSFFTKREIMPEYMDGRDAKNQYNANTTETSKQLGEILGVSPLWIDHFLGQYFGTTADMNAMAFQQIFDKYNIGVPPIGKTPKEKLASGPGMAAFLKSLDDNAASKELIYDLVAELEKATNFEADLKTRKNDTNNSYFEYEERLNPLTESSKDRTRTELLAQKEQINVYKQALTDYNKELRTIRDNASTSPEAKREEKLAAEFELTEKIPLTAVRALRQDIYGSGRDKTVLEAIQLALEAIIYRNEQEID